MVPFDPFFRHSSNQFQLFPVLVTASWTCWLAGGLGYSFVLIYLGFYSFDISFNFKIATSIVVLTFSLRFFCLWVPFAMCLLHWSIKANLFFIIYLIGCAVTIILSILATTIIDGYRWDGALRNEYIYYMNKSLSEDHDFPLWMEETSKSYNCCGWAGPLDFGDGGRVLDITKMIDDPTFMKKYFQLCFNHFPKARFNGKRSDLSSIYLNTINPKKGCSHIYKSAVRRNCYLIAISGIIMDILVIIVATLYLINFNKS